jgi:hypothetical protein
MRKESEIRRTRERYVLPAAAASLDNPLLPTSLMLGLGTLIYVAVLLVNSVAVLSEERFLVRSASASVTLVFHVLMHPCFL